ncbi:NAD(P)H-dependent oxidoreductase, partial [Sphingomonas adhaesiva]|uniref:NAD(P)H-dependent oxidoreductase n=1 Tax=Sphingomonas adhaesiva TaxID=28212 RepID=UPI001471A976
MSQSSSPRHYVVLANPSPKSFCHTIARTYVAEVEQQGQSATIVDLCTLGFDPVLKDGERADHGDRHHPWVTAELERIAACRALVLVYPIWFGGPPAILKGYVDRVLGAHCGFRAFREGGAQPALSGRYLLSMTTSGTPIGWLEERGQPQALR